MKSPEEKSNLINESSFDISPSLQKICKSGEYSILKRIYDQNGENELSLSQAQEVSRFFGNYTLGNNFLFMDSKLYEKIKEILGYENSSVTTSVQQVAFDLAAIYTKMDGLLYPCYIPEGTHSFQSDIIQNNIICIYRQVLTTPLSEIEAQVDMQITTIANNIMLRRLSESTKIGEDRETIAMAAHILSQ